MKVCPTCAFTNEECYPTCICCHTVLVDVPSIPAADPNHPEHEQKRISAQRAELMRRQLLGAGVFYSVTITIIALLGGGVTAPLTLALYGASGALVAFTTARDITGRFLAAFLQGGLSVTLMLVFGPIQLLIFYMLAAHIFVAMLLVIWVEMIHSANR